jgi:DNA polymerase IIIc chi subunit
MVERHDKHLFLTLNHQRRDRDMDTQSDISDSPDIMEVQGLTEMRALAEAGALAEALAEARVLAEALEAARAEAGEEAGEAAVRAEALVEALTWVRALARVRVLEVMDGVEAQTQKRTLARARAEAQALEPTGNTTYTIRYDEVFADSNLRVIISSIDPAYHSTLARDLWRRSNTRQAYWWFIQLIAPITRLPTELLQQILLIIIDEQPSGPPLVLMLVSKYWYTTVTGIWASLTLGTTTPEDAVTSKLERNQWLLDVLVDTEIDHGHSTSTGSAYQAIFAAIEASSRWRSFVVETFPTQADLPEHIVNRGLQRCSGAVMNRLRIFKIKSACEVSPLLDRLLRILGISASRELTNVEINSPNVISFLVSMYPPIFHSITVLSLDTPGLRNPVDLLPHLHQLEALTASHLPLPAYHNDINLPFVHTLRHLRLRAVSIQWMSGRIFHVLESCTLRFPLHRHILHTSSTNLPNCEALTFEGYPLDIPDGFSAHKLTHLSVISPCSKQQGNHQLVRFASQAFRESQPALRILHIRIEATARAWKEALAFMSNLEELVIDNARPSSLGVKVLQSLIVHPVHADNLGTTATLGGQDTPICPSLKRFGLRYRRWLRSSEHVDLIPDIVSIIWSRKRSNLSLKSFCIWTRSDQKDPMELIEGPRISIERLERLANEEGENRGGDSLRPAVSTLLENMGAGQAEISRFLGPPKLPYWRYGQGEY